MQDAYSKSEQCAPAVAILLHGTRCGRTHARRHTQAHGVEPYLLLFASFDQISLICRRLEGFYILAKLIYCGIVLLAFLKFVHTRKNKCSGKKLRLETCASKDFGLLTASYSRCASFPPSLITSRSSTEHKKALD
jgi:hypothetical protein